jgi:hypothetical protein
MPRAEVSSISADGFWLVTGSGGHFLAFADYPWFRSASSRQISNVAEPMPGHFHWPDLDVDLSLQIIRNPERFPLKAKTG